MVSFGDRLKKMRKEKGLTQEEIGNKFNLSKNAFSCYERGERQPPIELIKKLADYFDVSLDYIFGRTEIKYPGWYKDLSVDLQKFVDKEGTDYLKACNYAKKENFSPEDLERLVDMAKEIKNL